jgi:FKBP-type peptidyl-prolyl cis-trans isomerase
LTVFKKDLISLPSKGIDYKALKAGKNIVWEKTDEQNDEDNFTLDDEDDVRINYEKLYKYRNMSMVGINDDDNDDDNNDNDNEETKMPFEILMEKMVDITPEKDGGVMKRILSPGVGLPIPNGSRVRIHYNAYYEMNENPLDSTYIRNKSQEFKLGANQVIIGLEVGVATMLKHEKAQFIFAPFYFCGETGCAPRVLPKTPVMFEVEVISFVEASAYDNYEVTPENQRSQLTFEQMLQIVNCLREVFISV